MDNDITVTTTDIVPLGTYEGQEIRRRLTDGYVCATDICQANGKLFNDYYRCKESKDHAALVESITGIPVNELIQSRQGQPANGGGTWVHEDIALDLVAWCSTRCRYWYNQVVKKLLREGSVTINREHEEARLAAVSNEQTAAVLVGMKDKIDHVAEDHEETKKRVNVLEEERQRRARSNLETQTEEWLTEKGQILKEERFGWCPCCELKIIVDLHGKLDPDRCVLDNFYNTTDNLPEDNWPVCNKCRCLLDGEDFRKQKEPQFRLFQELTVREHRQQRLGENEG